MSSRNKKNHFKLSTKERHLLTRELSAFSYDARNPKNLIEKLRILAYTTFPNRLIEKLESLKGNDSSYCIFDNLPIEKVTGSPTENSSTAKLKSGYLTENLLLSFGAVIAEPYAISFEGSKIVNDLTPHKKSRLEYTGLGSEVELDFHIENAAQISDLKGDTSPLALLLLGVRKDPNMEGPKTLIADARKALGQMSSYEIAALYAKNFIIRKPFRWRTNDASEESLPTAILTGPIGYPRVSAAFYSDMVTPTNKEAEDAYNIFKNQIKRVSKSVEIKPGRLVFINNRFTLHAREKFQATYDKNGAPYRWIQRIFITNNLWAFRHFKECGNRIFDPSQS
ncbi:hypothetical protein BK648_05065 [Pseudomonas poae]|uniref:Uncharacterized protein n=1 Tax=Pseudomonas poae TaxID=200451 RepID=A0A423FJI6_9PSED|nr:TauD/TfdA family dioxygenase [Pseudomonas poae]ROM58132.1 hypothetical protein BK648_05065 [Pseudomonas poae]